jgi:SH3 domain-containing YSC84-like protein 1
MKILRQTGLVSMAVGLVGAVMAAQSIRVKTPPPADDLQRIDSSVAVLKELTASADNDIPQSLLQRAEGIVVIPTLVKGGFIVGAKHGRGILSAREAGSREWSLPVFVTMTGGSIGWQIGLQSVDLVLLVMNPSGVTSVLDDKFTVGGTLSLAAGPVGRAAEASTDAKLNSQILAYSRAKGLFAGATLEGASLHPDKEANRDFYGPAIGVRALVSTIRVEPDMPAAVTEWHTLLASFDGAEHSSH